jgi:hypothetical protein
VWRETAKRQEWAARAAAWDADRQAQRLETAAEEVRKAQERQRLQVRHLFNQVIKAGQRIDPDKLSAEQVFRWTERLVVLERLLYGQPMSVEQVRHAGPEGGPVQTVNGHVVSTHSDPDPAYLAQVLAILAAHGGLSEPAAPGAPERGNPPGGPGAGGPSS